MEIQQIPVISTSHLSQEVAEQLTAQGNNNPWVSCASWDHGFFICTQKLDDLENAAGAPQCLLDIKVWLASKAMPCSNSDSTWQGDWVRLDGAGDKQDDLPVYDW